MRYKKFGDTGLNIPVITIGDTSTIYTGEENNTEQRAQAVETIQTMVENGAYLIDTAHSYQNGESELNIGAALQVIDRSKVMINSKFGILSGDKFRAAGVYPTDTSPEVCLEQCEDSLKRIGSDYFDIYMAHRFDPNTQIKDTMSGLTRLQREGKIRYIGLSNYNIEQIKEASRYGKIDMIEMSYSMIDRRNEETLKWAYENHISTMVYGPLGAGILTGRYKELPEFAPYDGRLSYRFFKEPMFSRALKVVEKLEEIAANRGVPVSEVTINWTVQKPFVTTAIIGSHKKKHAEGNIKALQWELTEDEIAQIDEVIEKYAGKTLNLKPEEIKDGLKKL